MRKKWSSRLYRDFIALKLLSVTSLCIITQIIFAQKHVVLKGLVQNDQGYSLVGASVGVKDKLGHFSQGTETDSVGNFYFTNIPNTNTVTISVSYKGYKPQELKDYSLNSGSVTTVYIKMERDTTALDEVVVVGYGTQKKVDLTGAISQVDEKVFNNRPLPNVAQALQGAIPNLNISFGDGHPGSVGTFNVRGFASINNVSGSPLIVIDGVPGTIDLINPNDIATVTVLKDAASAAIYGARAGFGVILITTKSSKNGKVNLTYGSSYGLQTPTTRTDFMTDGYSQLKLVDEAFSRNVGSSYSGYTDADYEQLKLRQTDKSLPDVVLQNRNGEDMYVSYGSTDWWHYLYKKHTPLMDQHFTLNGGNGKTNVLMSGRYFYQSGLYQDYLGNDNYKGYNLRSKINSQVNNWLSLYSNMQFSSGVNVWPGTGMYGNNTGLYNHAMAAYVPRNPDGSIRFRTNLNNYASSEYPELTYGKSKGSQRRYDITEILGFKMNFWGNKLLLEGNFSYEYAPSYYKQRSNQYPWSVYPQKYEYNGNNYLTESNNANRHETINIFGTYNQRWKDHHINVTMGYNQELQKYKYVYSSAYDLLSEDLSQLDLATGTNYTSGNEYEWALKGFFGRVNYDFKDKYLLEFNSRYDGTSRFDKNNRFGFFPSVSAGWKISSEEFFSGLRKYLTDLKLRASYGLLGNQDVGSGSTDYYPYIPVMNNGTSKWVNSSDESQVKYISAPNPVTPNFTWEKTNSYNIGVDATLFQKIHVTYDRYRRDTRDMLISGKTLPATFGASSPKQNAGNLQTDGFELSVSWNESYRLGGKPLSVGAGLNLSNYSAKITKFDNPEKLLSNYYVGEKIGQIWGYSTDGLFSSDAEAAAWTINQDYIDQSQRVASPGEWSSLKGGDVKFKDLDGNGKINNGDYTVDRHGDLKIIGNSLPRYSYGINLNANWNNIDVSMFFQGVMNQDWYPGVEAGLFWGVYGRPYSSFIPKDFDKDVWTENNKNAYFPVVRGYEVYSGGALNTPNDRYLQNIGYLRLKSLVIGYTLSPKSGDGKGLLGNVFQSAHFFFSGQNLFTWTKLRSKYIDPESVGPYDTDRGSSSYNSSSSASNNTDSGARSYPYMKSCTVGVELHF